jgi:hyperosmotically inducible protein
MDGKAAVTSYDPTSWLMVWLTLVASAFVLALALAGCAADDAGNQIDDALVTGAVKARLAADPEVNSFEIDVNTEDGVVRLRGLVETEAERDEAEELARSTEGARRVINEIQLGDPTLGETVSDAMITTRVLAEVTADVGINPLEIDVHTQEGVVTLSGHVETEEKRIQAERVAREVKGVKDVRNLLQASDSRPRGEPRGEPGDEAAVFFAYNSSACSACSAVSLPA